MGKNLKKTLVVIRHCHRDKTMGRKLDNGLSEKGLKQREKLTNEFSELTRSSRPTLMSSPKLRCFETLIGIAEISHQKIQTSSLLDEQRDNETIRQLMARVTEFLRWWNEEGPSFLLICTHGDWVPTFFRQIMSSEISLKKGGWIIVENEFGKLSLKSGYRLKLRPS